MKNLIYTLFATAILLTSCSNENDPYIYNPIDQTKTYEINFALENKGININKDPLTKALDNNDNSAMDVVVYKESGEVFKTYQYSLNALDTTGSLKKDNSGKYKLSLILPEGKYHIAFGYFLESFKWTANNYFTDKIVSRYPNQTLPDGVKGRNDNYCLFFSKVDVTVPLSSPTDTIPVTIKPAWSNVYVTVNTKDITDLPEGATGVYFGINPDYRGLNISTELATDTISYYESITNKIYTGTTALGQDSLKLYYPISATTDANNNLKFYVQFVKESNNVKTVISEKIYDLNRKLENGYNYNIKGTIKSDRSNQSMNISLGSFSKEDVVINF